MNLYSLLEARSHWSRLSHSLLELDDEALKEIILKKIVVRNQRQDALSYRKRIYRYIKARNTETILDFGCGVGTDGLLFALRGVKVTFADISKENVMLVSRYSKIFGVNSEAVWIDTEPSTYVFPESYDMIFSNGVLHHTPDAKKVVVNLAKHLKKDGCFIVMLYTPKHYVESVGSLNCFLRSANLGLYARKSESNPDNPYSDFYDKEKAKQLFEGFTLVSCWTTFNGKFGWYDFRK